MKLMQYTYNFEPEMYKYILSTNILNKKKGEDKIFKAIVDGNIIDTFDPSNRIMRCAWRIE